MQFIYHFSENYVEPVIHHPTARRVFGVCLERILEGIKVIMAKVFLEHLGSYYLSHSTKITKEHIYQVIVRAPIVEEWLFRGVLLRVIHLVQDILTGNKVQSSLSQDSSDIESSADELEKEMIEDKQTKRTFRIHLAALIFAAAHLSNPHPNKISALTQFAWSYLGGVIYGHLTEKYDSLAPGILAHGINNLIATASLAYPQEITPFLLLALFVNRFATYHLAVSQIDQSIYEGIKQALNNCYALPERLCSWQVEQSLEILSV